MTGFLLALLVLFRSANDGFSLPGMTRLNVTDPLVIRAAKVAAEFFTTTLSIKYLIGVEDIKKASQQEHNGMYYRMEVTYRNTKCERTYVDYDEIDCCEFDSGKGAVHNCVSWVYRNPQGDMKHNKSMCQ